MEPEMRHNNVAGRNECGGFIQNGYNFCRFNLRAEASPCMQNSSQQKKDYTVFVNTKCMVSFCAAIFAKPMTDTVLAYVLIGACAYISTARKYVLIREMRLITNTLHVTSWS